MLYWCLLSQTSLRTHWKTCFTGVCWVELHSEHTEKHALLVFVESNFTQNTLKKHALLVFVESNFTQNTEKTCFTGLLSRTSLRTHWKTCFTGVCWVKLHSEHTEKHALLVFVLSRTSLRTHWKTCFTGVCWVKLHSEHTEKHALLVFVESNFTQNTLKKHALLVFVESNFTQNTLKNMLYWCLLSQTSLRTLKNMLYWCFESNFTQNTLKNMLYWCLLSRTSLRTHWKTCFTGVCWVELHSEHTEKHALLVFVESNFTQNTLKNMLYWCLLSRTSLRTHWKTCFTGVCWVELHSEHTEKTCFTGVCWVELHSEHTEKHALLVFVESNFTQNTLKNMLYWCFSQTSLRTHWKTCFTGVLVKLHSEHTEKTCFTGVLVKLHSEHTEKYALLVF